MSAFRLVRPCLVEFWLTVDFPASVRGPVECWALARLAAICAAVDIRVVLLLGK